MPRCCIIFLEYARWIISTNPYLKRSSEWRRVLIVLHELFFAPVCITIIFAMQPHPAGTLIACVLIPVFKYIFTVLESCRADDGCEDDDDMNLSAFCSKR